MTYPLARTPYEAQVFLDLTPCVCGETRWEWSSTLAELADGTWVRRYAGTCPACGRHREYVLRVPPEPEGEAEPGEAMFGSRGRPSELVDAGQWLWVSDQYARDAPTVEDADRLSGAERDRAGARLVAAMAAVDQIAGFFGDDEQVLPEAAFWTSLGRSVRAAEASRLTLAAVEDRYLYLSHVVRILRPPPPQPRAATADLGRDEALRELHRRRAAAGPLTRERELSFLREERTIMGQDPVTGYSRSAATSALAAYSRVLRDVYYRHYGDPARQEQAQRPVRAVFAAFRQAYGLPEWTDDELADVSDPGLPAAEDAWRMVVAARQAAGQDPETGEFPASDRVPAS